MGAGVDPARPSCRLTLSVEARFSCSPLSPIMAWTGFCSCDSATQGEVLAADKAGAAARDVCDAAADCPRRLQARLVHDLSFGCVGRNLGRGGDHGHAMASADRGPTQRRLWRWLRLCPRPQP